MHPRTLGWFTQYAHDHQHPTNRLTHKIAIPAIVFHVIAMLTWLELGTVAGQTLTVAHIGWVLASAFWIVHLPRSGAVLAGLTLPVVLWGSLVPWPVVVGIAVVAWLVQLAGHAVWEKNSPSFLRNMMQALVGPLFFTAVLMGEWRGAKATAT